MPTFVQDKRRTVPWWSASDRFGTAFPRHLAAFAISILLAVALLACVDDGRDSDIQSLMDENAALRTEIAGLRESLDERDDRIRELEEAAAKSDADFSDKTQWSKEKEEWQSKAWGNPVEMTADMAEDAGGVVHYVQHPGRGDRTVLVLPREATDGEIPLIVSLHGFGGDSAHQSGYIPLHERVNDRGFGLLLSNGMSNAGGSRSWNPTDDLFTKNSGDVPQDDVAYLTELVEEARKLGDFGPVYLFGYSNGGFMAYHMACRGLPGLRAVASLSGTSYVDDSSCDGTPAVSVLHVHGTEDSVILYDGDGSEAAFYASAQDMVTRWSRRAGCDWPDGPQSYATLDLDRSVPGSETEQFRVESGCTDGIDIQLWTSEGSGHVPDYGDEFRDALLEWVLSQE